MEYSIELGVVRRMLGEMYSDRVGSCKEFVRRIQRYSIRVESCKEFVRRIRGIRLSWEL